MERVRTKMRDLQTHPWLTEISERKMHDLHPVRVAYYGTTYRPTVHEDTLRGTSIFVSRRGIRSMPDVNTLEISATPDLDHLAGRVVTMYAQLGDSDRAVCRTGKVLVLKRSDDVYHLNIRPHPAETLMWADME